MPLRQSFIRLGSNSPEDKKVNDFGGREELCGEGKMLVDSVALRNKKASNHVIAPVLASHIACAHV